MPLFRIYRKIVGLTAAPLKVAYFFDKDIGRHYDLGFFAKAKLIAKFPRNNTKVPTAPPPV